MPKAVLKSGLRLHYQRVGHGPDLVMIHGLTGNLAVWHLKIVPLLMDHFRILTYDLRGHGYSDMPQHGYTCTDMAADLRELLDALEIQRAALVGHSFGGDIALYSAFHDPDRVERVMAIEAALPAMIHTRAESEWQGWSYWSEVLERSGQPVPPERRCDAEYLLRLSLNLTKKWGPLQGLPRNPEPFLRLIETTTALRDYPVVGELKLERLETITTPIHLLYGERSAFLETFDCLRERLPKVTSSLLPRTDWGHFGPLEQPDRVAAEILAFCADGAATTRTLTDQPTRSGA